ncbi:ATP-dependent DNA helicase RecQ [Chitinispirillum alkaliphilum]|nr:ATP-dependent DNA helicase RecQ [Chitinispirillum alkaliphilum]
MSSITYIDTEINPKTRKVLDIGAIKESGETYHSPSISGFTSFVKGSEFVCGHNILNHDLKYVGAAIAGAGVDLSNSIDTLYLSPLLFPKKPYHALVKDEKLQSEELNNPLNDAQKARSLFHDEVAAFRSAPAVLQQIFFLLLLNKKEFSAFFKYVSFKSNYYGTNELIRHAFKDRLCTNANFAGFIAESPVELAYSLSLIYSGGQHSITPPWVLKSYPDVQRIMLLLRNKPCLTGCSYCNGKLDVRDGLKRFFGFDSYRSYNSEPLQERAAKAAIDGKSLLAIFPTGGGKSITFQVPALMSGENVRGLTVVISPLQSLMKDQVDNLESKGITEAVTINGLLDPIERSKSFERVEDGSASLLYISPESLRSKTIERLILGRNVVRFVIDEAHCFSSWGQDFRVDYLYIGDFINRIQEKKNLDESIPVSCFTATAKQNVIEDIKAYFRDKLSIELELFSANSTRENLTFKVMEKGSEDEKYSTARALIEDKQCPTIVYVSRTRRAYELACRLTEDGFDARPFHGKMDVKEKIDNQNAFISGDVQVMVATSAFGMGVDKKDVGMVIHYDISDSLENYVQEAGRAGRDENISAECYVLFNEEDLGKHFILLNQTKLNIKEIQQVWKAIKELTRFRSSVSNSALEIARKAGWDENVREIETRVTTAVAALEESGYLKRGQNMPRIYASSIMTKNAQEAIDRINYSKRFDEKQKVQAIRIIKKLFSSKSRKISDEDDGESRVDYISDHLGIVKEDVICVINLLREERILADAKDLTAFIYKKENQNRSAKILQTSGSIEMKLLSLIDGEKKVYHIKKLNEELSTSGLSGVTPLKIKRILNFWAIKNHIRKHYHDGNHVTAVCLHPREKLKFRLEKRLDIASFTIGYLYEKARESSSERDEVLVEFSVHELKEQYLKGLNLFKFKDISNDDIEDALFYLTRTEAIKIEGGFLVTYNKLTIERLELNNKRQYKAEDYQKLNNFYENKIQQIHIVGEYAKKMISDYRDALQFVEDYFRLNYSSFLKKYFKGSRQNEIRKNITPSKFRQLFGELSPAQLKIINDRSPCVVVAAGPGSGKTRVLVHKLASLLLVEDVKYEQLLMLTFSRAAATEFKCRLYSLIGNAAGYVEIKTFHSYCFDLLGRIGTIDKSTNIVSHTVDIINSGEVEPNRINKTVLVIDEAQDMSSEEFALVEALLKQNDDMRVIAVGDDDQNIFEFRGSSSEHMVKLLGKENAVKYELIENYRSRSNLVQFTNCFVSTIPGRLKKMPILAHRSETGNLRVSHYKCNNLISPMLKDILSVDLKGTTCVLTYENMQALQVASQLRKHGMNAKLIQTNDGFDLYNLLEIRVFIHKLNLNDTTYKIPDEVWERAKREMEKTFSTSSRLEVCREIITDFERANPRDKFKTDFEIYLKESKLEDFYNERGETIVVSTIHKAKGKEFDNLFLMLEKFNLSTAESKRQLYVAMTRAKQNLYIYTNGSCLNNIKVPEMDFLYDESNYPETAELVMPLSYKDVWLDYFQNRQKQISALVAGDPLFVCQNGLMNSDGTPLLMYSKKTQGKLAELSSRGYTVTSAKVNFIVIWKKPEQDKEIRIVSPEITLEKIPNQQSPKQPNNLEENLSPV